MLMKTIFRNFLNLFFPPMCIVCRKNLVEGENHICLECFFDLPKTNFLYEPDNPVEQLFAGRIPFERVASNYHFVKGGSLQKIIHELKYCNNPKIGIWLGNICGNDLKDSEFVKDIDYIVPVPLHPKRKRKRGYNQCSKIAEGLSQILNIPSNDDVLFRTINNQSQTTKTKSERLENVSGIFTLKDLSVFEDKHVLLVDDLVTTGATLEECAKTILQSDNVRISIFTVASAH